MNTTIKAALRDMLGPFVGVGVTDPQASADDVSPDLAVAVARAIPKRRAEFAAGRRAVRVAMADLGLPPTDVAQGADRAPVWPDGLTGSIAHCDTACIAAVSATHTSLGIDIEPATPLDGDLWDIICTAPEQAWITTQANAGLAAKMVFSAKEAVFKAQYPITGRMIGFEAVTLNLSDAGDFRVIADDLPTLAGHIHINQNMILSVCMPQDRSASL